MKISSVSKKVLASALSAAMVVAFAPTVAFGAVNEGDTVYVQFDTSSVAVKDANAALQADAYEVVIETADQVKVPDLTGHAYQFDKNTPVATWYADLNDNGKADETEPYVAADAPSGVLDFGAVSSKITPGATITLKPAAAAATIVTSEPDTIKQEYIAGNSVTFTVKNNSTTKDTNALRVALLKDGKEIAYAGVNAISASGQGTATFNFVADDTTNSAMNSNDIKVGTWGKGAYSLEVVDKDTFKTVATAEWSVVEISLEGVFGKAIVDTDSTDASKTQYGQTILAIAGKSLEGQLTAANAEVDVAALKVVNGAPVFAAEYTVDGKTAVNITYDESTNAASFAKPGSLTNSVKVAEGMVLSPAYADAAQVGKPSFTAEIGGANDLLKGEVKYTKAGAEYVIAVSGAATAEKKVTGDGATISDILLIDFGSAGAAAGTYTVTVTETTDKGTNQEKSTVIGSQDITLTEVTIDKGEHSTVAGTKEQTSKSIVVSTTKVADVIPATAPTAKEGYRFVGWSLDGTNVVKGTELVGESAVTLKAVYAATVAEKPSFSYADGLLTLVNNAGSNYDLQYTIGTTTATYTGPITLDAEKNGTVSFQSVRKTGVTTGAASSAVVTITNFKTTAADVEQWAKAAVAEQTGASTAAKPQVYSEALTTVVADAKAAITALNYGTTADWNKAALAQKTAVLQAIADYENAQIDALVAGVKQADGSMKKLAESTAAKQKQTIAGVVADFGYNNDYEANGTTADDTTKGAGTYTTSLTAAGDYVKAIAKASKAALDGATAYKAEDVTAAEAVTAQLTAAKTGADAEAALAAYAALTDAQKALVANADVTAAQKVADEAKAAAAEEAQQALIDAQDEGTLNKIKATKTKTYTLKSKKKTTSAHSISYTTTLSKSGNAVTYAKVSGSAKITVSEAGKVKLKKGAVKGKTYTATVLAACGTQTRTVKVKFSIQ